MSLRWKNWQSSLIAQQHLTTDAASQGYTLLRVSPAQREVFLDLVTLLQAQAECVAQDLDAPDVWQDWRRWTRHMTAYLRRLAQGQTGRLPPRPASFALMEEGFDVSPPL